MQSNLPPSQSIQDETKERTPKDDPTVLQGVARSSSMDWLQFLAAPTLPAFDTVPPPPSENDDARKIDDDVDFNTFAEWDSLSLSGLSTGTDDLLWACNAEDTRAATPIGKVPYTDHLSESLLFGQGVLNTRAATPNAEDPHTDTDVLFGQGVSANNSTTNNESNLHVDETRAATPSAQVPYTDNDVLFGQGGLVNKHSGNRRFRSLADDFRQPYNATSSREEKRQLVEHFVTSFVKANGARFWSKDGNGTYVEVNVNNKFYANKFKQLIREEPGEARKKAKQRAIRRAEKKLSSQGA